MNKAFEKILERLEGTKDIEHDDSVAEVVSTRIWNKAIHRAKQIVKEVAEEYNGGWIACSERLPEESLNSVIGWDEYRQRCCFVQYYGGRWIIGNDIDSVKIIAWQPLPEPYQPKGE